MKTHFNMQKYNGEKKQFKQHFRHTEKHIMYPDNGKNTEEKKIKSRVGSQYPMPCSPGIDASELLDY